MAPRAVLMKTSLIPLNTARPVNTAHPKTTVYSARPMVHFSKSAQSTVKRPYQIKTALTNKNFNQKVNTTKGSFYTARPKVVNTARPNSVVVNALRANQVNAVKASSCWVWRPTKLNSASITLKKHNYVDARGRSKHMIGSMSYIPDFKEFDRGYVTFGGGAKGGKITGKETLKTGKLDFEDTRRMTKTTNEQGFISAVYEGKTREDLHTCLFACFLSQVEPKKVIQALTDPSWIEAMQDELLQFKLQKVWTLVDLPYGKRDIAFGLLIAYALFKDFVVYKMDVKSAFLYGKIKEEVYICQPLGFEDPEFPDRVYKVEKVLYGLHQAPGAWYETLSSYLLDNRFQIGPIDKTLFIKRVKGDIILVKLYVDDFIFGSTRNEMCTEFEKMMHKKFQMSSIGELKFLLGLICKYLKGQPKLGLWYPKDSPFDMEAYTDSDYAGASLDRKSTTGGCQFLRCRLISWQCKKQTIVANFTTKVKYVAAASCYGQVLWIQNQILYYGYIFMNTKIFMNNESTICIVENPVFHSKTKHIEIRHHFIRDSNEKKLIQMIKIHTDQNVVDLLTKAFDVGRFQYLIMMMLEMEWNSS
ncbi:putative ribonuclease H-like domain-containing protein [Tanacetum coccineum]